MTGNSYLIFVKEGLPTTCPELLDSLRTDERTQIPSVAVTSRCAE
jgi:hypothetical protein